MPDTTPGQDSTAATTTPQGAEAPANDQPGQTEGAAETPHSGFDEAFLKGLDELDPSKVDPTTLGKNFNDRFVSKAEFTKKTQALADERRALAEREKAIFDVTRRVLAERDTPKGPSPQDQKREELLQLAAAGDKDALSEVVRMEASRLVDPLNEQYAIRNAAETARAADPAVVQHWNEIVQTLQSDPALRELAGFANHKYADKVMLALGLEHKTRDQAAMIAQRDAEVTALKGKLSQYEKERVVGLPGSTTRAGTTAGRSAPGDFETIEDAGRAAWVSAGGRAEDYR